MTAKARRALVASMFTALALDTASKVAAVAWLDGGPVRLGPLLTLRLVHNAGIAFGVAAGAPAPVVLAVTTVLAATMVALAWRGALGPPLSAGLIAGGALANVADRATGATVIDFLDVGRWPTFNLADVFLVTGIALLVLLPQRPDAGPTVAPALSERAGR